MSEEYNKWTSLNQGENVEKIIDYLGQPVRYAFIKAKAIETQTKADPTVLPINIGGLSLDLWLIKVGKGVQASIKKREGPVLLEMAV